MALDSAKPRSKEDELKPGRARRYRRKVAGPKQWQAHRAELLDEACAACGWGMYPWTPMHAHHLVPRSMGGDDVIDNLVALHPDCHQRVTEGDRETLAAVAASLNDARYAYVVGKLGEGAMTRLFGV